MKCAICGLFAWGDMVGAKGALQELFTRADQGLVSTSLVVDALLQMAEWLLEEEKLEDQTCAEYWLSMTEPVNQFCASSWDVPETISVLSHAAKNIGAGGREACPASNTSAGWS